MIDANEDQGETNKELGHTAVASHRVWSHQYKLYTETEHGLKPIVGGPLVDAWVDQCNRWSTKSAHWPEFEPTKICLNSMLCCGFASTLGGPEDTRSYACGNCEGGRTFRVVYDSDKGLLRLFPRRTAREPTNHQVPDVTMFINTTQIPTD